MEVTSERIFELSSFPRATSLIPITILMGVRSSWETLERKTAFCRSTVRSSANIFSYHLCWAVRRLIQNLAREVPPRTITAPSTSRRISWKLREGEIVCRTKAWYSIARVYRATVTCKIHFLFRINRENTIIPAIAGISNRLASCTLKKKNSNSSRPEQRLS